MCLLQAVLRDAIQCEAASLKHERSLATGETDLLAPACVEMPHNAKWPSLVGRHMVLNKKCPKTCLRTVRHALKQNRPLPAVLIIKYGKVVSPFYCNKQLRSV
jgi:hypothetical protein